MSEININVTGDVFLGGRIKSIAEKNPKSLFDKKIINLFSASNLNIVNLESPLTKASEKEKLIKTGPNLKAYPETIGALKELKVDLVTLANNHIYDYGKTGLTDTLQLLKNHGIKYVGAGLDLKEANKFFLEKINGITIAILNIAENEWCNANDDHGGANPMDIIANINSIKEAKQVADYVILVIHGGHELYYYPSPRMIKQYRFYAEQGASLIVGHHSHCVSGYEIHKQVPIFYGLGNFLFDAKTEFEGWYEGVILNIKINREKKITYCLHPYKQCKSDLKVELLEDGEKTRLENKIKNINTSITSSEKIKNEFDKFVKSQRSFVLSILSTSFLIDNRFFRGAIRKSGLERFFLRKSQLKSILNYFRCESHKEISTAVILDFIDKKHIG